MDKIICLGKNYAEHAAELGEQQPAKPVIFLKPPSVLHAVHDLNENNPNILAFPSHAESTLHHEIEIVCRLDKGGFRLNTKEAAGLLGAVTVGLDMTLRDLQQEQKKAGHPWTTSKVFKDAAVIGPWCRVSEFPNYLDEKFSLFVDGQIRQEGFGNQMLFSPLECIAYISQFFPLYPGDIVFTGTPKGIAPVQNGNRATLSWGPLRYHVCWGG